VAQGALTHRAPSLTMRLRSGFDRARRGHLDSEIHVSAFVAPSMATSDRQHQRVPTGQPLWQVSVGIRVHVRLDVHGVISGPRVFTEPVSVHIRLPGSRYVKVPGPPDREHLDPISGPNASGARSWADRLNARTALIPPAPFGTADRSCTGGTGAGLQREGNPRGRTAGSLRRPRDTFP
jgi:hypothetical protein